MRYFRKTNQEELVKAQHLEDQELFLLPDPLYQNKEKKKGKNRENMLKIYSEVPEFPDVETLYLQVLKEEGKESEKINQYFFHILIQLFNETQNIDLENSAINLLIRYFSQRIELSRNLNYLVFVEDSENIFYHKLCKDFDILTSQLEEFNVISSFSKQKYD